MDDDLRDMLSQFAGGVQDGATKIAKRLIENGCLQAAGDILRRSELLTTTIKRAAGPAGLRVDLEGDELL
jgi:hypothetical protein